MGVTPYIFVKFVADNMINKISELREQYDAAQATGASSLIRDIERASRPELRNINQELNQKVNMYI